MYVLHLNISRLVAIFDRITAQKCVLHSLQKCAFLLLRKACNFEAHSFMIDKKVNLLNYRINESTTVFYCLVDSMYVNNFV